MGVLESLIIYKLLALVIKRGSMPSRNTTLRVNGVIKSLLVLASCYIFK